VYAPVTSTYPQLHRLDPVDHSARLDTAQPLPLPQRFRSAPALSTLSTAPT